MKKKSGTAQHDVGARNPPPFPIDAGPELPIDLDEMLLSVRKDLSNYLRVPFPQANDLDKIIDITVSFGENRKTSEQISKQFKFHGRQGDYYANAAVYLGFLERDRELPGSFVLTWLGKEIKRCPTGRCRNRILFVQLLKKPVFRSAIILLKDCNYDLNKITKESVALIIRENYSRYTPTTSRRRASTVISWIKWICANFKFKSG